MSTVGPIVVFCLLLVLYLVSFISVVTAVEWILAPVRLKNLGYFGTFLLIVILGVAILLPTLFFRYVGEFSIVRPVITAADPSVYSVSHIAFNSKITYSLLRPTRGEIVLFGPESRTQIANKWRADVPQPYHFIGPEVRLTSSMSGLERGSDILVSRVVALPGEKVKVAEGNVRINGRPLIESYANSNRTERAQLAIDLADDEYLVSTDRRYQLYDGKSAWSIIRIEQIQGREVITLWPLKLVSVHRLPEYNVPSPPVLRLRLDGVWARRFAEM
jgi:signal peptidase I